MSKFIKTSKGLKGFFKKIKPKFDPKKIKNLDAIDKANLIDFNAAKGLFKDQFFDMLTDEKAMENMADLFIGSAYNWTENNLTPDQIASLVETADKGALQFSNAPEITANNKSRFVKISQEEQPAEENQKPKLPNFTIEEVVNNLVKAAQEAEANNLGEKEVAMSMAKVLRSYNDKLAPFKGQLREQGINLNDIAPRR
jgi:hypothetical protein